MDKFASWRLGKTSVEDIHRMNNLPLGLQKDLPRFNVKCTQVPQEFTIGTHVFIWLGSDNNKGIPTNWKQGFKAIGRLVHINRGEKFGDESTSVIEVDYIFPKVINRIDILREAPIPYYWCSSFPIIGLDDHSNQTIRMFSESDERSKLGAFFEILKTLLPNFYDDALKISRNWYDMLEYTSPNPKMDVAGESSSITSTSFHSSDLKEFWNKVGQTVLGVDEDFSKLPRYYHKGHIRVKTNYGGAVNFSLGFYDKKSDHVNADVSFNYGEITNTEGEHIFYLYTDIKNATAFDKFIPVFNETYKGIFEISKVGETYNFTDLRSNFVEPYKSERPLQVIYYGAPGTGKSHTTDKLVENDKKNLMHQRTTFHPDSDYSSFVGCYKPSKENGELTYKFVPQAFLKAYVAAWKNTAQPYYLIIEEINRGNCAQIFGDIFQLLDRRADGFSKYHITSDTDIAAYLRDEAFAGISVDEIPPVEDVNIDQILSGEIMQLPSNLHIYATMNTSDQSLFPIDSAFKRRWDWDYKPIEQPADPQFCDWKIVTDDGIAYDWWNFLTVVNDRIFYTTQSEDKKMGYWFSKADSKKRIPQKTFIGKVLFYLWNDVFKDYARTDNTVFKVFKDDEKKETEEYTFTDFFRSEGVTDRIHRLMFTLGIEREQWIEPEDDEETINVDADTATHHWEIFRGELKKLPIANAVNLDSFKLPQAYFYEHSLPQSKDVCRTKVIARIAPKRNDSHVCFYMEPSNSAEAAQYIEDNIAKIQAALTELFPNDDVVVNVKDKHTDIGVKFIGIDPVKQAQIFDKLYSYGQQLFSIDEAAD